MKGQATDWETYLHITCLIKDLYPENAEESQNSMIRK